MSGPESLAGAAAELNEDSAGAEVAGGTAEGVPITELAADGACRHVDGASAWSMVGQELVWW